MKKFPMRIIKIHRIISISFLFFISLLPIYSEIPSDITNEQNIETAIELIEYSYPISASNIDIWEYKANLELLSGRSFDARNSYLNCSNYANNQYDSILYWVMASNISIEMGEYNLLDEVNSKLEFVERNISDARGILRSALLILKARILLLYSDEDKLIELLNTEKNRGNHILELYYIEWLLFTAKSSVNDIERVANSINSRWPSSNINYIIRGIIDQKGVPSLFFINIESIRNSNLLQNESPQTQVIQYIWLQIGAYSLNENAESTKHSLEVLNLGEIRIIKTDLYRVYIICNIESEYQVTEKLLDNGYKPFKVEPR